MRELFQLYPRNDDTSQVLLKVAAVNGLYLTNIYDVLTVAKHIAEKIPNLDSLIQSGSSEAVEKIARVQFKTKSIRFFSFATKYCSWQRDDLFPIFDYWVERNLWNFHKECDFHSPSLRKRDDLWSYESLRQIVFDFKSRFGLDEFGYKDIDKFLYYYRGFEVSAEGKTQPSEDGIAPGSNQPS